ncbi:MAG TPA: tetratricopeptide repeat protein [Verrucomicrobiae bacterium]|nr:tetratricopeptide repeat protein [Verrucomicrobiae bacterium]
MLLVLGVAGCSKESRKARHLTRASQFLQAGEIDKAEIEYGNVIRLDPNNKAAVRQLGLIYFDQGKPAKAYPLLKQAEGLDPNDFDVRLKLASLYLAGRRFSEVRAEAEYVLQKQPDHDEALVFLSDSARTPEDIQALRDRLETLRPKLTSQPGFHLALGNLAFRQKNLTQAEASFKEAVRLGPKLALAHSMLGNLYLAQENLPAAEAAYKTAFDLSPFRSPRRFDYIDFKIRHGDGSAGRKLLEEIAQKTPDNLPALNRLAELNLGEKKYAETAALLRKIQARDPQNYEAQLTEGLLHLGQADMAKAIAHFERMAANFPTVPKVRYHLALALLGTNNTTEAVANLNRAIAQDPDFAEPVLMLAEINIRKGDTAAGVAQLSELIRRRPRLADAYLLLANAHRVRNNLGEALSVYSRLAELYPQNPQVPLLIGSVLLQQNKTNDARLAFDKALKLAPNYLPALEQLIALELVQRQFSPALDRIKAELQRTPNSPELHILLAKAYYEQGRTNDVEKELQRAIELNPAHREPYVLLARLYIERNEHMQAIDRLKRVIARDSRDVPALMLLGMIYNQLNDFNAARDMYEKVLVANARFSLALNNLAYLYSEHFNQLERAFQMAQRARALLPWDAFAADTLGWILFKREEYSWALSLLQESADKLLNQPEVLYHLGMAQYMMGYETAARVSLERALQLNKDFTGHDLCVRRLAILAVDATKMDDQALAALEEQLAPDKNDPVALAKLALAYENAGAHDKARRAYEQALALSPKNVSVMIRLANLYHQRLSNPTKAMDLARRARAFAPDDPAIAHSLGRIALNGIDASELEWANSLLQESARKLPGDPEVAYDLAWSQFTLGHLAEAEAAARTAIAAKKPFSKVDDARQFLSFITGKATEEQIATTLQEQPAYMPAIFAAAAMHERHRDLAAAQKAYRTILARYPSFVPAHTRLALIFDSQGDLPKAFEHASKARELAPLEPDIARTLGIIAFKRGDFARSAQLLRESARQRRSDAELFYYLGMAHYRLKQLAESREALRQAVALNIAPGMAQEAQRVLAEMN